MMFDINDIGRKLRIRLNTIKQGEYLYVGNNIVQKPPYPYATIGIISAYIPEGSGIISQKHIKEIDKLKVTRMEFPQCIFSISCYSDNEEEARKMAMDTLSYLKFTGRHDLSNDDIIVLEVSNVQDRSIILEKIEYEFRYGLDVRIRVVSEIGIETDYAKKIEIVDKGE